MLFDACTRFLAAEDALKSANAKVKGRAYHEWQAALAELRTAIARHAMRAMGSRDCARGRHDDIAQDTLVKLFGDSRPAERSPAVWASWLRTVIQNKVVDSHRRPDAKHSSVEACEERGQLAASGEQPEQALTQVGEERAVEDLLVEADERWRSAPDAEPLACEWFGAVVLEQEPVSEVAEQHHRSVSDVQTEIESFAEALRCVFLSKPEGARSALAHLDEAVRRSKERVLVWANALQAAHNLIVERSRLSDPELKRWAFEQRASGASSEWIARNAPAGSVYRAQLDQATPLNTIELLVDQHVKRYGRQIVAVLDELPEDHRNPLLEMLQKTARRKEAAKRRTAAAARAGRTVRSRKANASACGDPKIGEQK